MVNKFFNHQYNGAVPIATGDRYHAQDFLRDFWFLMDRVGMSTKDIFGLLPILLSGGGVNQGAGSSLDIVSGYGYAKYPVTIPDDWSTSPPGTIASTLESIRISWAFQNDINASSNNCSIYTVTDDGFTVHYVKMKFKPSEGNTRKRAKAIGTYPYELIPDFDLQVDSVSPGDDDICLITFTSSGGTYTFQEYVGNTLKYSSVEELSNNLQEILSSDFTAKKLIIDVQNSETVDIDADNIVFDNSLGNVRRVDDIDVTLDMTADRPDGTGTTNELGSHWYQGWIDSDLNKALVPDLTGVADSFTSGELRDSTAAWQTHLVQPGDIVFNLDDKTQTTVISVTTERIIVLADNIFPGGDENYKIRMLSPVGLGEFKARVGAVYNNPSFDLDDSTYTQVQEEVFYSESVADFIVSSTNWTTSAAFIWVRQVNDWTGMGVWTDVKQIRGTLSVGASNFTINITGTISRNTGVNQHMGCWQESSGSRLTNFCYLVTNTGDIVVDTDIASTAFTLGGPSVLERKPSFHK